jgi:O-antigen ligase
MSDASTPSRLGLAAAYGTTFGVRERDGEGLAPSANRGVFWMAVAVVGLVFFTLDFEVLHNLEELIGTEAAEMAEIEQAENVVTRGLTYLVLLGFGSWALFRTPGPALELREPLIVLTLAFVGWCMASILWSDDPRLSAMRWIQLVCIVVAALGIGRQLSARDVVVLCLIVFTAYTAIGLCAEIAFGAFRPWSDGYRFSGGEHPNTQSLYGEITCLGAVAMLGDARWPRHYSVWILLFATPLLLLTGSRTACGAVVVAVLVYLSIRAPLRTRLVLGVSFAWVALIVVLFLSLAAPDTSQGVKSSLLLGRAESAGSLTGRVPLWTELWERVQQHPIAGYGYSAFWTVQRKDELWQRLEWVTPSAHNTLLEALLSVGFVGATILVLISAIGWWTALRRYEATRTSGHAFWLMFMTACWINCLTESPILTPSFMMLIPLVGIVQLAGDPAREDEQQARLTRAAIMARSDTVN